MLVLVFVIAAGAVLAGVGSLLLGRTGGRRFDDVERFHRARGITTEWARRGVSPPLIAPQPRPEDQRDTADA